MRRRSSFSWILVMALSVLARPQMALAAPPAGDPVAEASALYDRGLSSFDVADYDQALILWNQAYVSLSPTPEVRPVRASLVLNIVLAHERAYEVSRNPDHLGEAMRLIDNRKAEITHFYGQDSDAVAEQARLDARRVEIANAYLAAINRGETPTALPAGTGLQYQSAPAATPAATPNAGTPVAAAGPTAPPPKLDTLVAADPTYGPQYRQGKGLVGGGVVLIAAGGVGVITAVALAGTGALAEDLWFDPRRYYRGAAISAGVGGLALIGGITMVVLGNKSKREAEAGYSSARGLSVALPKRVPIMVPMLVPRGGGVGFVGRF